MEFGLNATYGTTGRRVFISRDMLATITAALTPPAEWSLLVLISLLDDPRCAPACQHYANYLLS